MRKGIVSGRHLIAYVLGDFHLRVLATVGTDRPFHPRFMMPRECGRMTTWLFASNPDFYRA